MCRRGVSLARLNSIAIENKSNKLTAAAAADFEIRDSSLPGLTDILSLYREILCVSSLPSK